MAAQNNQTPVTAYERNVVGIVILIMAGWAVFMLIVKFYLAHHGRAIRNRQRHAIFGIRLLAACNPRSVASRASV